jgi:hypothetical protein
MDRSEKLIGGEHDCSDSNPIIDENNSGDHVVHFREHPQSPTGRSGFHTAKGWAWCFYSFLSQTLFHIYIYLFADIVWGMFTNCFFFTGILGWCYIKMPTAKLATVKMSTSKLSTSKYWRHLCISVPFPTLTLFGYLLPVPIFGVKCIFYCQNFFTFFKSTFLKVDFETYIVTPFSCGGCMFSEKEFFWKRQAFQESASSG